MATYYVSKEGSDSNPGTQMSPWLNHPWSNKATGQSLAAIISPGDSIILRSGDLWDDSQLTTKIAGTADNRIITRSDPLYYKTMAADEPVISGGVHLYSGWSLVSGGIYRIGLSTQTYVVFSDGYELIENPGNFETLQSGEWDWDSNFLYVNIGSNPNGGSVTASQRRSVQIGHGYNTISGVDLEFSNDTIGGVLYVTAGDGVSVQNASIQKARYHGARILGVGSPELNNVSFQNTDANVDGTALLLYADGSETALVHGCSFSDFYTGVSSIRNVTVESCVFERIKTQAIVLAAGNASVIKQNEFSDCWNNARYPAGMGTAIKITGPTSGLHCHANKINRCYVGIYHATTSGDCGNSFSENVLTHCLVDPILHYQDPGTNPAEYRFNTVIHSPIMSSEGYYAGHGFAFHINAKKAVFTDNIIYVDELTEGDGVTDILSLSTTVGAGNYTLDIRNNFYGEKIVGQSQFNYFGTAYSFENFIAQISANTDITGDETGSVFSDPIIAPSGRLSNISPCVDTGTWITGVNDTGEADPWGNYVHRLPNIGADQGAGSPGSIQIVFRGLTA